jgi:hypothetical protein
MRYNIKNRFSILLKMKKRIFVQLRAKMNASTLVKETNCKFSCERRSVETHAMGDIYDENYFFMTEFKNKI